MQLLCFLECHSSVCNMLVHDCQLLLLSHLHLAHLFRKRLLLVLKPGRVISEGRLTEFRLYQLHLRWDISAWSRWHLLLFWDTLSKVLTNFRLEHIVILRHLRDFTRVILLLPGEWWHCLVHMHWVGGRGRILKRGRVCKRKPDHISLDQIIAFGLCTEDCLWLTVQNVNWLFRLIVDRARRSISLICESVSLRVKYRAVRRHTWTKHRNFLPYRELINFTNWWYFLYRSSWSIKLPNLF